MTDKYPVDTKPWRDMLPSEQRRQVRWLIDTNRRAGFFWGVIVGIGATLAVVWFTGRAS